jgi:hypothetical protein
MEPMGIERHRWASREAEMSGSERVNTALSGSGRVNDIEEGLKQKATEFTESGSKMYTKV